MKLFSFLCAVFFSSCLYAQDPVIKYSINTGWKFQKGSIDDYMKTDLNDEVWDVINIPHTYNADDVMDDNQGYYQGKAVYRKKILIPESYKGKKVVLHFEGACSKTEVYVNNRYVGQHLGAYTAFHFDVEGVLNYGEENTIAIKVDNSENLRITTPPVSGDFSLFGGIYRDVYLLVKEKTYFNHNFYSSRGVFWQTPEISKKQATLKVFGQVANEYHYDREIYLEHKLKDSNGSVICTVKDTMVVETGIVSHFDHKIKLENPILWSPDAPYLYLLESSIYLKNTNEKLDYVQSPVAFRWFELDKEKGFFLNGNPLKLKGAARHQDYKDIGTALPNQLHNKDMQLLKEMGANFIRISHYPQDPEIYKACDELGIIAWSEIPTVNWVPYGNPFLENSMEMMKEMVYQNYNHPCVAFWGYHNEIWTVHEEALTHARSLENLTRKIDPHRLTAMAFHSEVEGGYFDVPLAKDMFQVAMVNGFNVYRGWYRGKYTDIGPFLEKLREYSPDRPVILSEYGAGSDIRIHTYQPTIYDFSPEYQVDYHEEYLNEGNKRDWMIGYTIWNFIDFQRDGRKDAVPNVNSKGILTTDRKPKDTYYYYQARWSPEPMIHIAGHNWKGRVEIVESPKNGVERPVQIYSNLEEIELYHNGKSMGKKKCFEGKCSWVCTFINGNNDLKATGKSGTNTIKDQLSINYWFVNKNISKHNIPQKGLCLNLGQARTFFTDDLTGDIWVPCPSYTKGSFGYLDGEIYIPVWEKPAWKGIRQGISENIKNTELDPVYQTFMKDITEFRFDVPDGSYMVSLHFSEPFSDKDKKQLNAAEKAWGMESGNSESKERIFDIYCNNLLIMENINLTQQFGIHYPVVFDMELQAVNGKGLLIELKSRKGHTILNGIKITR